MSKTVFNGLNDLFQPLRLSTLLLVFSVVLCCQSNAAHSDVTVITENTEELNLIVVSEYFEDKDGRFRVSDLNNPENDSLFKLVDGDVLNKGISESVIWVRFDLRYLSYVGEELGTWLIEVAHPTLDLVTLYIEDDWEGFQEQHAGDKYPFSIRLIQSPRLLFPVDIRSGDTLRFYLRIETSGSFLVPIKLWSYLAYIEHSSGVGIVQGLILGILVLMLIYNLMVLANIRNLNYLYFVAHIFAFLLYYLSVSGFGLQYLWYDYPSLSAAAPFYISVSVTLLIIFTLSFLRLEDSALFLSRSYTVLLLVCFFMLPISMLVTYDRATWLAMIQILIVLPVLTATGLYYWLLKKDRPARYFTGACALSLCGGISYALLLLNRVPVQPALVEIIPLSGAVAIAFLSLALASRIRRIRDERVLTEVHSRQQQEKICHRLVEGNRLKGEFLNVVSHELEQPIRSIAKKLDLLETPNSSEQQALLGSIRQSALGVDELITYLVALSSGQTESDILDEIPFNVQRQLDIVKDGVDVLFFDHNIDFQYRIASDVPETLYADADKLFRALRYVIENIIKHSPDKNSSDKNSSNRYNGSGIIEITVSTYQHSNLDKIGLTLRVLGLQSSLGELDVKEPQGLWWPVCRQLMHIMGGTVSYTVQTSGEVCFELSVGSKVVSSAT